ncbi:MAG: hypothetical protein J5I90_17785 [Caldilineales bacterium]|nr:hypothetical protein [Caldilineales bacterium]
MRVRNSPLRLDGAFSVEVELERALVHVHFNSSRVVIPSFEKAMAAAGNDVGVYEQ